MTWAKLNVFLDLQCCLLPTKYSFNNFFINNESTIQLLIQRLYSLPVPYSTEHSVTVDRYTASRLHPAMLEALTPVRTTGNGDCLWNDISICLCGSESYTYSLRLLTAYGLMKLKERMVAQLCVQNLGDTAGAERRWSDLLRIAITPTAWGTDFHVCVISVVLNIPIFMFTSFVRERDRIPSYYIDPSLDLTQLAAYFRSHGERCTAHQLHCSEEHVQSLLNEPYERWIRDPICMFFRVNHFVGLMYTSESHKRQIPVPYSRWYREH